MTLLDHSRRKAEPICAEMDCGDVTEVTCRFCEGRFCRAHIIGKICIACGGEMLQLTQDDY